MVIVGVSQISQLFDLDGSPKGKRAANRILSLISFISHNYPNVNTQHDHQREGGKRNEEKKKRKEKKEKKRKREIKKEGEKKEEE